MWLWPECISYPASKSVGSEAGHSRTPEGEVPPQRPLLILAKAMVSMSHMSEDRYCQEGEEKELSAYSVEGLGAVPQAVLPQWGDSS